MPNSLDFCNSLDLRLVQEYCLLSSCLQCINPIRPHGSFSILILHRQGSSLAPRSVSTFAVSRGRNQSQQQCNGFPAWSAGYCGLRTLQHAASMDPRSHPCGILWTVNLFSKLFPPCGGFFYFCFFSHRLHQCRHPGRWFVL